MKIKYQETKVIDTNNELHRILNEVGVIADRVSGGIEARIKARVLIYKLMIEVITLNQLDSSVIDKLQFGHSYFNSELMR